MKKLITFKLQEELEKKVKIWAEEHGMNTSAAYRRLISLALFEQSTEEEKKFMQAVMQSGAQNLEEVLCALKLGVVENGVLVER